MGQRLRSCCTVSVRALLVPALIAFAWLVWGAGTAQASPAPSGSHVSGLLDSGGSVDPAGAVSGAVPSLPAANVLPAGQDPVTATVSAVAGTADAVVGEAAAAVTTVTRTTAPVLSQVDQAVDVVDDAIGSLEPQLPRLPVPVPVVQLPVPVPVPVVQLPVPLPLPLPGQDAPPAAPHVPAPSAPDAGQPVAAIPAPAVPGSRAPAASAAAPSKVAGPPSEASSPGFSSAAPAAAGVQETGSRGQTFAQLRMTSSGRPSASAVQRDHAQPILGHPLGLDHVGLAATHGESGSTHSEGSGGQAADVAAFWNALSKTAGERVRDAAVALPPSPAFDPGSSPD
ncbi:hypothetical protein GCM10009589_31840 [Arthrobacter pascens]